MEGHMTIQYSENHNFNKMNLEEKIMFRSSGLKIPESKTREEALAELKNIIKKRESIIITRKQTHNLKTLHYLSVAAGILLLLGLWPLSRTISMTKVNASPGSHAEYVLSDGSVVNLNADSRIRFNKKNFSSDRRLDLEGEAFFNVTKGNSFQVNTPKGNVKVLGTTFNVYSRNNSFKVTCFTGKVMVSSGNQAVTIGPEESAELTGQGLKTFRESKPHYVNGWINGEFYFENTPLNLVLNEIERQFNVKFVGKEKERQEEYYTGSFFNKDLKAALDIVCIPMGLQYVINDNGKISISDKK
jgi:ferric-dicitrate binding protein FerR (iron transport regulator)